MFRVIFLCFLTIPLLAVVQISPREVGENPGISGEVSGLLGTKRGNTDIDNYSGAFFLQYDNNVSYLVWGVAQAAYGQAGGVRNTNKVYSHVRYIENIRGKRLAYELFFQMQENEFKAIKDRILTGGDVRAKLLRPKDGWGGLFFGMGAFFENLNYSTSVDPTEHNLRINSYLAYMLNMPEENSFLFSGYYQPKIDNANDYIVALFSQLEVHIYKKLYLGFHINYSRDSKPAIGVKTDDFSQQTLFKYKF